ncbi:MAG: low molecular weight phosphotyrosine protein phosphatase [Clostridia bacterium]|nr:low molecular weight phosphotyrosine protein phosphatase [Clostridia bacterium]
MKKIMFVCHGNICRSPMAEFIFKDLLKKRRLSERFFVSSSATSTEEILNGVGNPVYPPAKKELLKHGISCDGKTAVQLKGSDYEKYDLFIGMDSMNIRNMKRILGEDGEKKIFRLMDLTDRPGDVSDPWFTRAFDVTYKDISEGCFCLLEKLIREEL